MNGTFEGFRLYQTVTQSGVPYPTEPEDPDIETKIQAAPSVWYVKEVVNPEYDESEASPTITDVDTGKRFFMFAMGNGPVLGAYSPTAGVSVAYLREGTYLAGFWSNGQLFGVPLMWLDGVDTVTRYSYTI